MLPQDILYISKSVNSAIIYGISRISSISSSQPISLNTTSYIGLHGSSLRENPPRTVCKQQLGVTRNIISSDCGGDHASDAHCWIIKNIISKIFFIDFKLIFPGSLFSILLIETDLHLNINWKLSTFKISTSNCWFPANRSPLHQNIHQKYCFLDCQKR